MTRETTNQFLKWVSTTLTGVAVFFLVGMYNRFEKALDTMQNVLIHHEHLQGEVDGMNKTFMFIDNTFEQQGEKQKQLMEDIETADRRLDYLEWKAGIKPMER